MSSLLAHFRQRYGANPWHLAGHLAVFAVAGFAIDRIGSSQGLVKVIALYVGFVIAHDLVLLPAYSGLDRLARGWLKRLPSRPGGSAPPLINHLRAPLLISVLLLLIYAPLISGKADQGYFVTSGHHATGYLRNWLLISAGLFLGSGFVYAVRAGRARRR